MIIETNGGPLTIELLGDGTALAEDGVQFPVEQRVEYTIILRRDQ
jgi:hypothetical protein